MLTLEVHREERAVSARPRPLHTSMTITADGLVLGAGTVLARAGTDRWGRPALTIDGAEERILTLLAVAYGKRIDPAVLDHLRRASEQWSRGEPHLALIHLAYTGLPKLSDEREGSFRLLLAERALADGLAPHDLLEACGFDGASLGLLKAGYDPNQPRVPAGTGRESGRWTTSEASSVSPVSLKPHVVLVDYQPQHELPEDAVVVTTPDGRTIYDKIR